MMDDFEFNYFGEEEGIEESEEFTDDYERRSVRVNRDGKKIRGKDMFWTKKMRFNNPRDEASNIIQELKDIPGNEGGEEVFSDCEDCRDSERLMCWSHVHRAITPQLKSI